MRLCNRYSATCPPSGLSRQVEAGWPGPDFGGLAWGSGSLLSGDRSLWFFPASLWNDLFWLVAFVALAEGWPAAERKKVAPGDARLVAWSKML